MAKLDKKIYHSKRFFISLILGFLVILLSLGMVHSVLATPFNDISEDGFEIFDGFSAQVKVVRDVNQFTTAKIKYNIEYSTGTEVFQWGDIKMDYDGIVFGFSYLYDTDNDNEYDLRIDQTFKLENIAIITSDCHWEATDPEIYGAESYNGTEPQNFLSQHDIIPGLRYSDPNRIIHSLWMKANKIPLVNFSTRAIEGGIDIRIDCILTTYEDKVEEKISVIADLQDSGLPISENTNYSLQMRFICGVHRRPADSYDRVGLDPDYMSEYNATYFIPEIQKNITSLVLDRDYREIKDGEIIPGTADPILSGPFQPPDKYLHGDYDFNNLTWGHTSKILLDPTISNYGIFGGSFHENAIYGFQIIPMLIVAFLGIVAITIKIKKKT